MTALEAARRVQELRKMRTLPDDMPARALRDAAASGFIQWVIPVNRPGHKVIRPYWCLTTAGFDAIKAAP